MPIGLQNGDRSNTFARDSISFTSYQTRSWVKCQACYNGAIDASAIQRPLSYAETEPVCENNAYMISSHTIVGNYLQVLEFKLDFCLEEFHIVWLVEFEFNKPNDVKFLQTKI